MSINVSSDDTINLPSPSCDPIVFSWDEKILPHSFFPTLIANLLQQNAKFALPKSRKEQKRHRVNLRTPQIPGGLCLLDATQWIELHYYGDQKHCPELRRMIEQSLSKVSEILRLPHMATPQLGFICNRLICDCDAIEERHICTLTEGTNEATCSIEVETISVANDERKICWLIQPVFNGK